MAVEALSRHTQLRVGHISCLNSLPAVAILPCFTTVFPVCSVTTMPRRIQTQIVLTNLQQKLSKFPNFGNRNRQTNWMWRFKFNVHAFVSHWLRAAMHTLRCSIGTFFKYLKLTKLYYLQTIINGGYGVKFL